MNNRKELSFADFLSQEELREMSNERRRKRRKNMSTWYQRQEKKTKEQALRLERTKDLLANLRSIGECIEQQSSGLEQMRVAVVAAVWKVNRLIEEQSPAPQRRRTSKKERVLDQRIEKMRRSLKKYKRKKT